MLGSGNHAPLSTVSLYKYTTHFRPASDNLFFFQVPEIARPASSRSQDDAMVSYSIYQRQQSDTNFQGFSKHHSRWLGDESIAEVPSKFTILLF
jgi:hypothetical protein